MSSSTSLLCRVCTTITTHPRLAAVTPALLPCHERRLSADLILSSTYTSETVFSLLLEGVVWEGAVLRSAEDEGVCDGSEGGEADIFHSEFI